MVGGMLGAATGCGDPYSRYASAVHTDVDAAMTTAFQMTARLQLTVVHNQIPKDSLPVAAGIVARAARDVRKRATHFAAASPPPDLGQAHAGLSADLSRLADALDAMGAVLERCTAGPCQAQLDSLSSQFAFVGEDLGNSRTSVRRLLLRHGVMLQ
jgi:hypothetical protein